MMEVDINAELKDLKNDIKTLTHQVDRMSVMFENIIDDLKENKKDISKFKKFKNKIIGIFTSINTLTVIVISIVAIII